MHEFEPEGVKSSKNVYPGGSVDDSFMLEEIKQSSGNSDPRDIQAGRRYPEAVDSAQVIKKIDKTSSSVDGSMAEREQLFVVPICSSAPLV